MRRILAGLAAACAGLGGDRAAAQPAQDGAPAPVVWRRVAELPRAEGTVALAVDPTSGEVAVGDASGVLRIRAGGRPVRVLRRGDVRDLVYLEERALVVATGSGLHRVEASGRIRSASPGPGAARRALRLAAEGGVVAAATEGGAFVSRDALRWRPIPGLPSGPATAAALRTGPDAIDCYVLVRGELHRARVRLDGAELSVEPASREPLAPSWREDPIDVVAGLGGVELALLFPSALALREAPGGAFRLLRPALPPGSSAHRVAWGLGRLWLATDRGLLEAAEPAGPWLRVGPPAGSRDVGALVGASGALHAVLGEAVYAAGSARRDVPRAILAELPAGPPIERIHRAALEYLGLGRDRIEALRRGVQRRGWLPRVVLGAGIARDRDRGTDVDEAVVSGAFHRLVDRDHGSSRDDDLSLAFTWELADLFYHPEEIDVSREAREVIELRDDVLDEITQLYFERSRVLIELAGARSPEEALRLRLRAAELAAGIDAWTGGWFSRALREPGS